MSNILSKITARAKQIHKKHPNKKWTSCIKEASAELKRTKKAAPKKKAAKKRVSSNRQTGSSNLKRDRKLVARKPGKRISRSGAVYYERRMNRSDKPGALSGVSTQKLKGALKDKLEQRLGKTFVAMTKATTKRAKNKFSKIISATKAEIKKLK